MTYKVINCVHLADLIASREMDRKYPNGWEDFSEEDPGVLHPATEQLQDEYNDLYDKAHTFIKNAEKAKWSTKFTELLNDPQWREWFNS